MVDACKPAKARDFNERHLSVEHFGICFEEWSILVEFLYFFLGTPLKLLWKLRFILKEYWRQYLLAFICLQIVSALNLISPWLIGEVVDGIKDNTLTQQRLTLYVGGIAISSVVIYLFRYVWRANLYGA